MDGNAAAGHFPVLVVLIWCLSIDDTKFFAVSSGIDEKNPVAGWPEDVNLLTHTVVAFDCIPVLFYMHEVIIGIFKYISFE